MQAYCTNSMNQQKSFIVKYIFAAHFFPESCREITTKMCGKIIKKYFAVKNNYTTSYAAKLK